MSGLTGAMNTALSGLDAYDAGITTVSENLTNASTPGYSVESVSTVTAQDVPGQPGVGVEPPQISRAADGFAAGVLRTANTAGQAASVQSTALTDISNALQNSGDVQSTMNQFFNDLGTLAASPTDQGAQQTVLSDAQSITGSFQSAAGSLTATMTAANTGLSDAVTSANNLLAQLAVINKGLNTAPNDPSLLDQQEAALNSLSSLLPINVLPQADGQALVYSGGTMLLDESGAQTLTLTPGNGATPPSVTTSSSDTPLALTGSDGSIGANIATYEAGATALQGLNAVATVFAASVNTAQAEGLTGNGSPGGPLFSVPPPTVIAAAHNTGNATLSAVVTNAAALPQDGGPFTLSYSGTGWSALDQSTGTSYPVTTATTGTPPATTLAFAGMSITVAAGTANAGDSYTVNPAPGAATELAVVASEPGEIAAADPFVATPGTLQASGAVVDTNAGTPAAGSDTVIGTAAAQTASAAGAATVPASFWDSNSFGATSLQVVFTSASAFNVETTSSPATVISSGTFNGSGTLQIAYPSSSDAAGQYWSLPITGTPAAGDVLTISPGGSSSGSNATRLAALWTAPGVTQTGTLQQSVVGFSTTLGANAQQAQDLATSTAAQVTSATTNLQTVAGVSTDQQAVLLTSYQQAYQAAATVISTANTMFESLLTAVTV
jgi:flagellar hook-associated protein 1 FlgK